MITQRQPIMHAHQRQALQLAALGKHALRNPAKPFRAKNLVDRNGPVMDQRSTKQLRRQLFICIGSRQFVRPTPVPRIILTGQRGVERDALQAPFAGILRCTLVKHLPVGLQVHHWMDCEMPLPHRMTGTTAKIVHSTIRKRLPQDTQRTCHGN